MADEHSSDVYYPTKLLTEQLKMNPKVVKMKVSRHS